jgi:maltose-binding protein MalE
MKKATGGLFEMTKKILVGLSMAAVMVVSAFSFAACGRLPGRDETVVEEADPSQAAEITMYVWDQADTYRELAAQFKVLYPNWEVTVQMATGDYFNNLKSYFGADMAPDIFYMESGQVAQFLRNEQLLNLSAYMDAYKDVEGSLKAADLWKANDAYKYDYATGKIGEGNYYAFAKDISADFVTVYNKAHIDEYDTDHPGQSLASLVGYPTEGSTGYPSETVPMTWDQSVRMSRALTKFDPQGNMVRYGSLHDHIPWRHVMEWVQMQGARLFSEDNKSFNASDSKVINAFSHLTDYIYGDNKSSSSISMNSVASGTGFKNGDVSVVWYGRWAFQAYDWFGASFDIGLAPAPVAKAGDPVYNGTFCNGLSVNKASKYPGVAYKFLDYILTSGSLQMVKSNQSYNVPGNKTIAGSDHYLVNCPAREVELNNYYYQKTLIADAVWFSPYIDTSTLESILGEEYGKTWDPTNPVTPAAALLACKTRIDDHIKNILKREGIE